MGEGGDEKNEKIYCEMQEVNKMIDSLMAGSEQCTQFIPRLTLISLRERGPF